MADKALSLEGAKTLYNDLRARLIGLEGGGEGVTITVDSSLSSTSINPVENRVIASKISEIVSSVTNNTSLLNTINTEVSRISDELESVSSTAESASSLSSTLLIQSNKQKDDITLLRNNVSRAETNISNLETLINTLNEEHDADIESLRTETIDYSRLTNTPTMSKVAQTGSYGDLTGTPTLATVALSGNYNDLSTKPDIPIRSSGIKENDSGYVTGGMVFDYVKTGGESGAFDPNPDSGYTYLPNGMLLQWGKCNLNSSNKTIQFPVSFVTRFFYGQIVFSPDEGDQALTVYTPSYLRNDMNSCMYVTDISSQSTSTFRWFAIGY